ncbi:hypothetical protein [Lunatibacter salilacus]|uniref:hypothetical protein n=1 Tax=Lunatibacter salilacus TaxID=2483804 RepID=UPI00131D92A5|nr:hypothetical protein [Lunatibacter salilacus]
MKRLSFVIILSQLTLNILYGQTELNLNAKTDIKEKSILLDKKVKTTLKEGENYKVKISGLNSAVTSMKVVAKAFDISSTAPEILKTVLPGISTSLTGGPLGLLENLDDSLEELRDNINKGLERLNELKETSDELYNTTIFKTDTAKARIALNKIIDLYKNVDNNVNEENIGAYVNRDIIYASTVKVIGDELLKQEVSLSRTRYPLIISDISATNELIIQGNYIRYINFIKRSTIAKNFVTSKPFYAEKDLVELKFTFVDIYKNDTISTLTRTLFTNKIWGYGLSFSSGFFYTEGLSDNSYYLVARQDENLSVLSERAVSADVSIGALGHIYTNLSSFIKTGPALGLAISPFDGKSRYLLGWSILAGREKMMSLTIGKAWAKQKQISSSVRVDDQGQYFPKGTASVPTFEKIVNSWFIGFSYNIATTRK